MKFDYLTLLGLTAAILTTLSGLPQLIKSLKTKKTHDLSLSMLILATLGIFLWLAYGILKRDFAIIFANSIALFSFSIILFLKIKYH
jgi:MtN3 and saliva related transmembrane protein